MTEHPLTIAMFPYGNEENPYQRNIRDALTRTGCDVTAIPREGRFVGLRQLKDIGVDVIQLDWLDGLYRGRSAPSTVLKSVKTLKSLRSIDAPMVQVVHNLSPHDAPALPRLDDIVEKKLVEQMCGFVHFSHRSRSDWAARHPTSLSRPSVIIRHGHSIDDYPNTVGRREARSSLGVDSDEVTVFLCFGGIRPYKGFAEFAQNFAKSRPSNSLLIVAGPSLDNNEVQRIRHVANLTSSVDARIGWVPDHEVQLYMNAADVGIAPFRQINTSGSVSLMQSFGLPVVVPKLGGLPETVLPKRSVVYELEDELESIDQAWKLAQRLGKNRQHAIEAIRSRDSWDASASNVRRFYIHLLQGRRTRKKIAEEVQR